MASHQQIELEMTPEQIQGLVQAVTSFNTRHGIHSATSPQELQRLAEQVFMRDGRGGPSRATLLARSAYADSEAQAPYTTSTSTARGTPTSAASHLEELIDIHTAALDDQRRATTMLLDLADRRLEEQQRLTARIEGLQMAQRAAQQEEEAAAAAQDLQQQSPRGSPRRGQGEPEDLEMTASPTRAASRNPFSSSSTSAFTFGGWQRPRERSRSARYALYHDLGSSASGRPREDRYGRNQSRLGGYEDEDHIDDNGVAYGNKRARHH